MQRMTVRDLMKKLIDVDPNLPVCVGGDNTEYASTAYVVHLTKNGVTSDEKALYILGLEIAETFTEEEE